jgi:hypothetical protein
MAWTTLAPGCMAFVSGVINLSAVANKIGGAG